MSRAEEVWGGAGRGVTRTKTGAAGFRFRREVNGRIRSSAPLLTGPSWSQVADGSGVGEADGNPFSFLVGRGLFLRWRGGEVVGLCFYDLATSPPRHQGCPCPIVHPLLYTAPRGRPFHVERSGRSHGRKGAVTWTRSRGWGGG